MYVVHQINPPPLTSLVTNSLSLIPPSLYHHHAHGHHHHHRGRHHHRGSHEDDDEHDDDDVDGDDDGEDDDDVHDIDGRSITHTRYQ